MARSLSSIVLAGSLGALLACGGCGGDGADGGIGTRAVVIGIDGADWTIIDALAAEGELPHLTGLRARAAWGRIETLPDVALSPVIWTSVATGKTATKHGVAWFLVDQPDGSRAPVRSTNRKTEAIWNIVADGGLRPTIVGWWATFPAEDVGRGTIVSDALGFHGFGATARDGEHAMKTHPASLFETADGLVPPEQQVSAEFAGRFMHVTPEQYRREMYDPARHARRDAANPIHLFQMYAVTAQGYTAIAEELLGRPYDLFMVYYEQVDSFSHLFMKYAPPRLKWIEQDEFERYRDVVTEWYRYQDELLGRLLARIDLETTAVFVVSDHGFKSGARRIRSERSVDVNKAHLDHETHGIFLAAGPHIRRGVEVTNASVLDLTPTLLRYLGLPVAKDMDGKVLEAAFEQEFRDRHPIRYVPTYENGPGRDGRDVAGRLTDEELDERERALRSLGYVGAGSGGPAAGVQTEAGGEESSPEIHNNLGRIHFERGEMDAARAEFAKALALDPNNAGALLNLGSLEREKGRVAEAERLVEQALRVDPGSVPALCQLAEIKRDRGDLDESIRLYRLALGLEDSGPLVHIGLGDALQRAGRYDEAERVFHTALELDPDSFEGLYNLGVTYLNQQRLDEARDRFEAALAIGAEHPSVGLAHNNLGDIHLRQGETEQAIERFKRAAAASPVYLEPRYNLAVVYLGMDRTEEAVALLEEAARLQPNHERVHVTLGMAYLGAGRNEDAYKSLLLVRRLHPENWRAALGLALLHAASDGRQEARALLDDALRLGGEQARDEARNYPLLQGL